jgi:flagellar protein FlbT
MFIAMKAGAKLYLNGAVIRFDRKTQLELLNDATFLLETHILQARDATTPLRQLYFCLQTGLIDPATQPRVSQMVASMIPSIDLAFRLDEVSGPLRAVAHAASNGEFFDCLKIVRGLFEIERDLLGR